MIAKSSKKFGLVLLFITISFGSIVGALFGGFIIACGDPPYGILLVIISVIIFLIDVFFIIRVSIKRRTRVAKEQKKILETS